MLQVDFFKLTASRMFIEVYARVLLTPFLNMIFFLKLKHAYIYIHIDSLDSSSKACP